MCKTSSVMITMRIDQSTKIYHFAGSMVCNKHALQMTFHSMHLVADQQNSVISINEK